jgi:hypothetical protein
MVQRVKGKARAGRRGPASGVRSILLAHRRSLTGVKSRWSLQGRADDVTEALDAGLPVIVSSRLLWSALLSTGIPNDVYAIGAPLDGRYWLADEFDVFEEWTDAHRPNGKTPAIAPATERARAVIRTARVCRRLTLRRRARSSTGVSSNGKPPLALQRLRAAPARIARKFHGNRREVIASITLPPARAGWVYEVTQPTCVPSPDRVNVSSAASVVGGRQGANHPVGKASRCVVRRDLFAKPHADSDPFPQCADAKIRGALRPASPEN